LRKYVSRALEQGFLVRQYDWLLPRIRDKFGEDWWRTGNRGRKEGENKPAFLDGEKDRQAGSDAQKERRKLRRILPELNRRTRTYVVPAEVIAPHAVLYKPRLYVKRKCLNIGGIWRNGR